MQSQSQNTFNSAVSGVDRLIQKIKPKSSTALKSFVVALFTADDENPLRFSTKIGLLQLDFDRSTKSHFLRFYDLDSLSLLLELQLFYGFGENYRNHSHPTLYIFDFFSEGVIGFQFRNQQQAKIMAIKIKSVAPKNEELRELSKSQIKQELEEKKSQTFFGKLKKRFNNMMGQKQPQIHQSVVLEVEKSKSIEFNLQTGQFDLTNIPPEWQQIFDRLNLTKEDLKDKEVVKVIFEETILHQAKKAAEQNPQLLKQKHLEMIKQQDSSTESFVEEVDLEENKFEEEQNVNDIKPLCPPPPPPPLPENQKKNTMESSKHSRADLMAEIRNNNLKLKPVKTTEKGIQLDASSMNRESRNDLAQQIRFKLQKRKLAINRRQASQQSDSD